MKKVLYGITGLCFLLLLLAAGGCASPARIIGIDSDEALVTVSGIDPADWQRAAEENIRSLLASGALRRTDGQQPVVMISRIRNYTMMHLESQILTGDSAVRPGEGLLCGRRRRQHRPCGAPHPRKRAGRSLRPVHRAEARHRDRAELQPLRGDHPADRLSGADRGELFSVPHGADRSRGLAVWENTVEILKQGTYPLFY